MRAQVNLGLRYGNGRGVEQNYNRSVRWLRRAAKQGDARANYNMGVLTQNGWGVAKSEVKAMEFFKTAARHGNAKAERSMRTLQRAAQRDPAEA